jgi:protein TonB
MFEQTFVNSQAQTRKPWTVAVSLTLQTGFVATILILPLLHPGTITPNFNFQTPLLLTKLEPPPPLPPETKLAAIAAPRPRGVFVNPLQPGRNVPKSIDMTPDPAPEILSMPMSLASALTEFSGARPVAPPPPPEPLAQKSPPVTAPVRVTGGVQSARLIFGPAPAYPQMAKMARVQGTVRIEAVSGRDGAIRNLVVTGGPALLVTAALQAVEQWRYRPTLLNGEPVEVITEIDVNFRLN